MKRQRSQSISSRRVKPRTAQRQDATVTAVVRKELRKKTDWKYTDHWAVATNATSSGTITSLYSNLVRGDAGLNNFDGNIIQPQAITMKYYLHTSEVRNSVRVMLIQWLETQTPSLTGVIQNGSTGLATISPILVTNKAFVKVLYDRTHQLAPTAADGANAIRGEGITDPVTVYIPGKRLRATRYNQNTNTCQSGNLFLLYVSDDGLAPSPQITYYTRVTFSDS